MPKDKSELLQTVGGILVVTGLGLSGWSLAETYKHESKQTATETRLNGLEANVKELKADIISDLNEIKSDVKEIKRDMRK